MPKPKKPAGPMNSLRPLTLSNGSRKILSMITLHRIQDNVDQYTGHTQAGYKCGRSCADIVWSQRMLVAVVMKKHWEFHKIGIDMSSAFDTIKRTTILNLLTDAGCSEDETRLVRFLLSNTKMKVKVNNAISSEFESLLGSFQGDCLSGKLFTLVLAGALHHLRAIVSIITHPIPNPPISDQGIPLESEYADDVDFLNEDNECLETLLPIAKCTFKEWDLFINEEKTEYTHVFLASKGQKMPDNDDKLLAGNESWCSSKILGSLLCTETDIAARCISGNIAFNNFKNVWCTNRKISLHKKLRVYEAQVVSVILYNCCSWSPTKKALEKLDICHRKHLRNILNIKWPQGVISNKNLYERCNSTPLSDMGGFGMG